MRLRIFSFVAIFLAACLTATAVHATLQENINQAVTIIERFQEIPEKSIPPAVMRDAKGLAILTVTKAGFIVTGKGGSGLVIARVGKGWSGPSAIGTGEDGFGFLLGLKFLELVIVLNTPEAVNAFAKGGNVTLGAGMSVAVAPSDVPPRAA